MTPSGARHATPLGATEPRGMEMLEMKQDTGGVHGTVARRKNNRRVCPECRAAADA